MRALKSVALQSAFILSHFFCLIATFLTRAFRDHPTHPTVFISQLTIF
jgi:hypothetical protein